MAWLAVDIVNRETISENKPKFDGFEFYDEKEIWVEGEHGYIYTSIDLPKGTILKILGYELTFENSPIEIK